MNNVDAQYLDIAARILNEGEYRNDRTGTGTVALFSPPEMRIDLREGFPLLTTKYVPFRIVAEELLWFISGSTSVNDLRDKDVNIWSDDYERWVSEGNADNGDLGKIYGYNWRHWGDDQLLTLVDSLKSDPHGRRHILSSWNAGELDSVALPACHTMFQCYVDNSGGLTLKMYQRSADYFLGKPLNIASYALLTHMLAQVTGLYAKELILTDGDAHIYKNHAEQITAQMSREPKRLPTLKLNEDITVITEFTIDDITLENYVHHRAIKGKLSVG